MSKFDSFPVLDVAVAGQSRESIGAGALRAASSRRPLAARIADWIAKDQAIAAMQSQWQQLETALFNRARALKQDCSKALDSNLEEARAMRALDARIKLGFQQLKAEAATINRSKATTLEAALGKIEIAVKVQDPHGWQDPALQLVENGLAELRGLLAKAGLGRMADCEGLSDPASGRRG